METRSFTDLFLHIRHIARSTSGANNVLAVDVMSIDVTAMCDVISRLLVEVRA